jgi:hypothetical protein
MVVIIMDVKKVSRQKEEIMADNGKRTNFRI